ncbi:MAG: OmpA family protein [candidate division KSB1 bacterium]|nr:OmpA family protein [candidate division KSB1 bacterium]
MGLGLGLTGLYDAVTEVNDLRLSAGCCVRASGLALGVSTLNLDAWGKARRSGSPPRIVLFGAGLQVSPWLELAGDFRFLWREKTSARDGRWTLRGFSWLRGAEYALGAKVRPSHFLELALRYDANSKLVSGGARVTFLGLELISAVATGLETLPTAEGLWGSTQTPGRFAWGISFVHHYGKPREKRWAERHLAEARNYRGSREPENATRSVELALRYCPDATAALSPRDESAAEARGSTTESPADPPSTIGRERQEKGHGVVGLSTEEAVNAMRLREQAKKVYAKVYLQREPAGQPMRKIEWKAQPRNLGPSVNSRYDDFSPSVTADGTRLFFTSNRIGGVGFVLTPDGPRGTEDFYVAVWTQGRWTAARNLGPPVNTDGYEGSPCVSADGQRIYFAKCFDPEGYGHCDIYVANLVGLTWSEPRNLGPAINSRWWEAHPSISADGRTLYFSRETEMGTDIWFSTWADTGWTQAVRLGPEVNTPFDEVSPFIHGDGRTLYFASNRPGGYGGYDLYMARRTESGWEPAVNLGPWINSMGDEKYFSIPAAGGKGYFCSSMPGGYGGLDLYEIDLPPEMRPQPVTTVKGKVLDAYSRKPVAAEIHVRLLDAGEDLTVTNSNAETGEYLVVLPSARVYSVLARAQGYVDYGVRYDIRLQDTYRELIKDFHLHPVKVTRRIRRKVVDASTGKPISALLQIKRLQDGSIVGQAYTDLYTGEVELDVPEGKDFGLFYMAEGYAPFSEKLVLAKKSEQTPIEVTLTKVDLEAGFKFRANLVFFDFNSDRLRRESTADLLQAVEFLEKYPNLRMEIQGHTDDIGSEEYNLDLSQRRAESVRRFLVEHGIDPSRLVAKGYGESMPAVENTSEENRQKNRRVEFKMIPEEKR